MASPKQGQGAGPPDPVAVAALQPKMLPCDEREGTVTLAPAARVATTAGRLRCKAFLVLAICLPATALLYSLGSLGALPQPTLGSLPLSPTQLGLPAPQRGTSDDLVTAYGDPLNEPAMQQQRRVLVGSVGTPGCFPGLEGDVTHCADAKGWTLGTQTPAPASPSTARTSPQQPGSRHGAGLRLGTALAGMLSPVRWLGTEVSATSAQLLQTTGEPSPGSQHHLAPGSLCGSGPGSHDAPQVPVVTQAPHPGQPVGTAEPWSPARSSEGSPPTQGHTAAWVPAASPARLQPPSLPIATPAPSVGAAWLQVVPTQLVSPGGAHVPADVPSLSALGTASQSHSMASQPRRDRTPGAPPDPRSVSHGADLQLTVSSKPPAVVTATSLSSLAQAVSAAEAPSSVPASHQSTASGSSDTQHGASVARATMRSHNGQKEEVRPDHGMGEDHPSAPQLGPLPGLPSAMPTERMSTSTEMPPGTVWVPSAVTPEMLWDTWSAGTFLHGEAALLVDTVFTEVLGNGSGLPATVLASLPNAVLAHDSSHLQVLAPFLPTAAPGGPAVTSGKPSDAPPLPQWQALPTPTEAHPSPALSLTPSAAGPAVTGVSLVAPDATPEPGVTEAPCEDRAAMVFSLSPRAVGVTCGSPLVSPTQRPSLGPDPFLTTASEDRPSMGQRQAMKVEEKSVLPGQLAVAEEAGHSELLLTPAGPLGPPRVSPGSVPPASSEDPAPERRSEPVQHTSTTSLASPSYLLTSTGAVHAASSPGTTLGAESVSSQSVNSLHPSTAREDLAAAAGEAFTPAELVTVGKPGSLSAKPPAPHPTGLPSPVHVLPLGFRLLGIAYTEALSSRASESYLELEEEVRLMLKQMLSAYETFLQANILAFLNGSVVVQGEALFRGDAPAPTNSHLIRTVVTEASKGRSIFSWHLEPQSVQSGGFSLENLDSEKLSISFTVFQLARNRTASLERLVTRSLSALYHVRNFSITQLRNISGDLGITGDLYLDTIVHADVAGVLQALTALATCSVDLTTLSVEGARLHLQVYPLSFLITNRHFSEDLLNPLAIEHQELTRDLADVVAKALRDHRSLLQVVIRGFLPGSLICHGDVVFQHPAPTSLEVLEALVLSVGPNKTLAGSAFQVDPYSLAVGEDTLEPRLPETGFPDYGVVIVVVCSLCIITAAIVSLLCLGTKRLGWTDVSVLWDRRDPEVGTQTLEMDNQVFWASSEQDPEDVHTHWHNHSVC